MWKSAQVSCPRYLHNRIIAAATIDFSLIQARLPIKSEGGRLLGCYFTVNGSCITIASRARSLILFVLKCGIKLVKLSVWQITYQSYYTTLFSGVAYTKLAIKVASLLYLSHRAIQWTLYQQTLPITDTICTNRYLHMLNTVAAPE